MKPFFLYFCLAVGCLSCRQATTPEPLATDPNWIKLEIPRGIEANAIAGDLDKTLLVATKSMAYYTIDQGKTWHKSKDFQGTVPSLYTHQDTVYPLVALVETKWPDKMATTALYFTTDYGKSWNRLPWEQVDRFKVPVGKVISTTGIMYQIQENKTFANADGSSLFLNPSTIIKRVGTTEQPINFPFKHILYNLHLDSQNRLYVAASGGSYREENNTFYCCEDDMPAIIYVSKNPLP